MATRAPSTFVCTITPFDEGGKLDESALALLLGRIGDAGIGAFVGTASPGEGHALSLKETERLYTVAAETLHGRVPVRAMGVEPRTADQFIELVRVAETAGLDAMQIYSIDLGHAQRPTDAELERYFRTVLETMKIPAVLSSHFFGGYVIPVDMIDRLVSDYSHIVGFNITTPDLAYLTGVIDIVDGRADVHVGGAMQAITNLALGGQGFLCSEGILVPRLCAAIINGYQAGDMATTNQSYSKLIRLFASNVWPGGSVRWTKTAMRILGLPGYHLRAPYMPLDDDAAKRITADLERLAIPELDDLPWKTDQR